MSSQFPPIVQIGQRLQAELDSAVRRFRKDDRYDEGARMRALATDVRRIAYRAWNTRERRAVLLDELVDRVDDLKLEIQLGKENKSFPSFREFEKIWRSIDELGMQAGAWRNSVQLRSQSPAPSDDAAGASQETECPRRPKRAQR